MKFINSDPDVIRLFLRWTPLIGVADDCLVFRVSLHETGDEARARAFWADVIGRPESELRRTSIKRHKQANQRRLPSEDYYGCLRVDVLRSTDLLRQIHGWWQGLIAAAVTD